MCVCVGGRVGGCGGVVASHLGLPSDQSICALSHVSCSNNKLHFFKLAKKLQHLQETDNGCTLYFHFHIYKCAAD